MKKLLTIAAVVVLASVFLAFPAGASCGAGGAGGAHHGGGHGGFHRGGGFGGHHVGGCMPTHIVKHDKKAEEQQKAADKAKTKETLAQTVEHKVLGKIVHR